MSVASEVMLTSMKMLEDIQLAEAQQVEFFLKSLESHERTDA
jgi:hypothetical protein